MKMTFLAPCQFGLESVLSSELRRLGAEDIQVSDGRVLFCGPWEMLARANIGLRTAERVQLVLGSFPAASFEELFEGVKALPLEDYIGRKDAFPVKAGWSLKSRLTSIPTCQSIIKKAAVTRLQQAYHLSWFEESGNTVTLDFFLHRDQATITLDASGASLHKRGYRKTSVLAPIKETLAAGIIDLARVYPDSQLYDPFCGSGTFLIEGALHAMKIAPGLRRHFAAEKWGFLPASLWQQERQRAFDRIDRSAPFEAFGSDIDPAAVELARHNAETAGVGKRIHIQQRDIKDFSVSGERSVVICNPPYGERLLDVQTAQAVYAAMGPVFPENGQTRYYIICPDEKFESLFGRRADKRRKLYNGMIPCQLYSYYEDALRARAARRQQPEA